MKTNQNIARRAGVYYLLMAIFGAFGMIYVNGQINVDTDNLATLANIQSNGTLYRLGILGNILCQVGFIFLALELYRLFKPVSKQLSTMLFALVIAAVPIVIFNEINKVAVLQLLSGSIPGKSFSTEQINDLALFFIRLHEMGIAIAEVFWGLWLLPLALLILKSNYLPRFIAYLLFIGCISYLLEWFSFILVPGGFDWVEDLIVYASIGEFTTMIYLTVWGVRKSKIQVITS